MSSLLGASIAAQNPKLKVEVVELNLPINEDTARELLWDEFVPDQQTWFRKFTGITTDNWRTMWDSHQRRLIHLAEEKGLQAKGLKACLDRLNYGRTKETAWLPNRNITSSFIPPNVPDEEYQKLVAEQEAKEATEEAAYQQKLAEREKNIEAWFNEGLAIAPIAAYQGKHAGGDCWIIICIWEQGTDEPTALGHVMIWALDAQSTDTVAYVSCD